MQRCNHTNIVVYKGWRFKVRASAVCCATSGPAIHSFGMHGRLSGFHPFDQRGHKAGVCVHAVQRHTLVPHVSVDADSGVGQYVPGA